MVNGKTALVLGGLGFIGTNLAVRLTNDGWRTVVVDIADTADVEAKRRIDSLPHSVEVVHAGMQDRALLAPHVEAVDVVFDLAGATGHMASMEEPLRDLEDNLVFHVEFLSLLRERALAPVVVLASTRQVLGAFDGVEVDDYTCPKPVDVNGVSKMALEHYLRVSGAAWGLSSTIIRLPNVYGPHMRIRDASHGVIGGWIGQALKGRNLRVFGTGHGQRNTLFVHDAVASLVAGVPTASVTAPTYLVGGEERSLASIAESISWRAGVSLEFVSMPESQQVIDIGSVVVDDSRFRGATGWRPSVGFDEGLDRTFESIRAEGGRGE